MLQIVVCAIALYFLVEKFGPEDPPINRKRVILIAFGALGIQFAVSLITRQPALQLAAIVLPAVLVWGALEFWCHLNRAASLKIAGLFAAINFAISIVAVLVVLATK